MSISKWLYYFVQFLRELYRSNNFRYTVICSFLCLTGSLRLKIPVVLYLPIQFGPPFTFFVNKYRLQHFSVMDSQCLGYGRPTHEVNYDDTNVPVQPLQGVMRSTFLV